MADKKSSNKDAMAYDIKELKKLENNLRYSFKNKTLLIRALTRKDAVVKSQANRDFGDQEALATLGDAVLKAILVHRLIESGCKTKGEITDEKKKIEDRKTLASISQELKMGSFMQMSNGEKNKCANEKPKPLAETLESVIGAIYRDAGYDKCMEVVVEWSGFKSRIEQLQK